MIQRALKPALVGLIVAVMMLLGACEEGPGAKPVPAWSPPTWIHGSWLYTALGERAIVKASKHNFVISLSGGGASVSLDLADGTEQGSYTVAHDAGVSRRGERFTVWDFEV